MGIANVGDGGEGGSPVLFQYYRLVKIKYQLIPIAIFAIVVHI